MCREKLDWAGRGDASYWQLAVSLAVWSRLGSCPVAWGARLDIGRSLASDQLGELAWPWAMLYGHRRTRTLFAW